MWRLFIPYQSNYISAGHQSVLLPRFWGIFTLSVH
jgi:hypothetical protein